MATLRTICAAAMIAACAHPAAAQTFFDNPPVSVRPFLVVSAERFAAGQTFETVFGRQVQPLYGGGLQLTTRTGFFFDITISRFKKTGERAFFFEGEGFGVGIPLTATLTPIEFTFGGRFLPSSRWSPYAGAGIGTYGYKESSAFEDADFEQRHSGYLVMGGADFHVSRWVSLSGDVQYTHVSGIIGAGGVSAEAGEDDLGGTAVRFRVLFGR